MRYVLCMFYEFYDCFMLGTGGRRKSSENHCPWALFALVSHSITSLKNWGLSLEASKNDTDIPNIAELRIWELAMLWLCSKKMVMTKSINQSKHRMFTNIWTQNPSCQSCLSHTASDWTSDWSIFSKTKLLRPIRRIPRKCVAWRDSKIVFEYLTFFPLQNQLGWPAYKATFL